MGRILQYLRDRNCRSGYVLPILVIVLLFIAGCADKPITLLPYGVAVHRQEQVSDGAHNREVNIIQIDADSAHSDAIFQVITEQFDTILHDYMNGVPYEFQNLVVDSVYCEKEAFLCVAVIASLPSQYYIPYTTACVYWNREEDALYSLEEYLRTIGIDQARVEHAIEEAVGGALYKTAIEGMFYLDDSIYFIVQVTSDYENGINALETMFYNYASSELIRCDPFSGFHALTDGYVIVGNAME